MTHPATSPTTAHALFVWPAKAAVSRTVAKAKIYAHANPSAALRALLDFLEEQRRQPPSGDAEEPPGAARLDT